MNQDDIIALLLLAGYKQLGGYTPEVYIFSETEQLGKPVVHVIKTGVYTSGCINRTNSFSFDEMAELVKGGKL